MSRRHVHALCGAVHAVWNEVPRKAPWPPGPWRRCIRGGWVPLRSSAMSNGTLLEVRIVCVHFKYPNENGGGRGKTPDGRKVRHHRPKTCTNRKFSQIVWKPRSDHVAQHTAGSVGTQEARKEGLRSGGTQEVREAWLRNQLVSQIIRLRPVGTQEAREATNRAALRSSPHRAAPTPTGDANWRQSGRGLEASGSVSTNQEGEGRLSKTSHGKHSHGILV